MTAALLVAGCARHLTGAAPHPNEIFTIVHRYDTAWANRDSAIVNSLLAPDYVYFGSRGALSERTAALAMLMSQEYLLLAATRSELLITHAEPGLAVVSSRWTAHGTYNGQPFTDDQRCTLLLRHIDRRWLIVAEHCTKLGPP